MIAKTTWHTAKISVFISPMKSCIKRAFQKFSIFLRFLAGSSAGSSVGLSVGSSVGLSVGSSVGLSVGLSVGSSVGLSIVLSLGFSNPSFAGSDDVVNTISLQKNQLPASDLLDPMTKQILSPQTALQREKSGELDLSKLEPDNSTDVWRGPSSSNDSAIDQALPIQAGDTVKYLGQILGAGGQFIFNVQVQTDNQPPRTMTLMLTERLHTYFLRKEVLRKLGYKIPAMKYISQVRVSFSDILTKTSVVGTGGKGASKIFDSTLAVAGRWVTDAPVGSNPLTVSFQDLMVYESQPVYYNLAFGPPVVRIPNSKQFRPQGPRIFKSLAVIFGLVNIPESINQVDWYMGRIQNSNVTIAVDDIANYACTLNDAIWISQRIAKLTRQDFIEIVNHSYYPDAVGKVLVEKLISRRNNLLDLFSLKIAEISFDPRLSVPPAVINGKVIQEKWPGYASRFAWGDPESPLKGLGWFALSLVESNVIDALFAKANAALPMISQSQQYNDHQNSLLQKAIIQYQQTGQAQAIQRGFWSAPIVNGTVNISRNVVLGNYLGTNNLVQLADTVSTGLNAGFIVGADALPMNVGFQGLIQGQVMVSLTHLKPLATLKQSVTEPLKEILVPLLFRKLEKILDDQETISSSNISIEAKRIALAADLDQITKVIDVGESLILTQSIKCSESITLSASADPLHISPTLSITGGANQLILTRLHFYRKSTYVVQIFKDKGELGGVNLAMELSVGTPVRFPILSISAKKIFGNAQSKIFPVNINPDPSLNPNIGGLAKGLSAALRTGSVETLEAQQKPILVKVGFHDSSTNFKLLHYVARNLKQDGAIEVQLPDGTRDRYVSLVDGYQSGVSYQSLATQTANYIVQRLTSGASYTINTQASTNPGRTFFGHSQTRQASFQAQLAEQVMTPFTQVQYRWEGFNITASDLQALVSKLSAQYGFRFFADDFLSTTEKVQLYQLSLNINIYENALQTLSQMSSVRVADLVNRSRAEHHCTMGASQRSGSHLSAEDQSACLSIGRFKSAIGNLQNAVQEVSKRAKLLFTMASELEKFVKFDELVQLVGGRNHLYVYAVITGFRVGSEIISQPIKSNGFGCANSSKAESCIPRSVNADGVLNSVENLLGINDGEFYMQWLRDVL